MSYLVQYIDKFQQINAHKFKYWNSLDFQNKHKQKTRMSASTNELNHIRWVERVTEKTRNLVNYSTFLHQFTHCIAQCTYMPNGIELIPVCNLKDKHEKRKEKKKTLLQTSEFCVFVFVFVFIFTSSSSSTFNLFASMANAIMLEFVPCNQSMPNK